MITAKRHATAQGSPRSLGARQIDGGVNFALLSEHAETVELCLFDEVGLETRIPVTAETHAVWHVAVVGIEAGQRYGYRVHGPWDPARTLFQPQ